MTPRRPRAWLAALLLAAPASAQPALTPHVVTMAPNAILSPDCAFASWTLTAAGTATVTQIVKARTDASPSAIIVAGPTRTGNTIAVQISPDEGCGTGCRNGNSYLITLRPEAGTDRPVCVIRVDVRKVAG